MNRNPIGCEEHVRAIHKTNNRVVVGVSDRSGNYLHTFPAKIQVESIRVREIRRTHVCNGTASDFRAGQRAVMVCVIQFELPFNIPLSFRLFNAAVSVGILPAHILR